MLTYTITVEFPSDDAFDAAGFAVREAAQRLADTNRSALVSLYDSEAEATRFVEPA